MDLLWKSKLLKKHRSCSDLEVCASRCFGGHGIVIAKELIKKLREEDILEDFLQEELSTN